MTEQTYTETVVVRTVTTDVDAAIMDEAAWTAGVTGYPLTVEPVRRGFSFSQSLLLTILVALNALVIILCLLAITGQLGI